MKRMKKVLAFLLSIVMVLSLVGCGGSAANSEPVQNGEANNSAVKEETPKVLTMAIPSDPANVSPVAAWTAASNPIIFNVYARLLYFHGGQYHMEVAESIEYEDDTHMVIKIRNDVKDELGNEMKASDVLFSLKLCPSGGGSCPTFVRYIDFDNCKVVDDYTLNLALNTPYAFQYIMLSYISLVTEAGYNASSDGMITDVVATGPYKIENFTAGSSVTLKTNENWFGQKPAIETVKLQVISEPSQITNGLETGEIQQATIQASDLDYLASLSGIETETLNTGMIYGLFFNCADESIFANPDARKAVAYAVNKDAINTTALRGTGTTAISAVTRAFVDYTEQWDAIATEFDNYYATNIEKAKELAESSGLAGQTITITYTNSQPVQKTISEIVQQQLAEIGVTVEIEVYDDSVYVDTMKSSTDWDISVQIYGSLANAASACMNTFIVAMNINHLSGSAYDDYAAQVGDILATVDDASRVEKTNALLRKLDEDVTILGLVESGNLIGYSSNLNVGRYYIQGYAQLETANWN